MDMKVNEEARAALIAEVADVSDEDLNKKPSADVWSIKQILEHLYLMEAAITNTVEKQMMEGEEEEAKKRRIELAVNRTVKVDAPSFAVPSDDKATFKELEEKLATTHASLHALAENYSETELAKKALDHPAFGKMSLDQWIPFVGYHELRHLEQIREVKTTLGMS